MDKKIYPPALVNLLGGSWDPKHPNTKLYSSSMKDIIRIYISPLRKALASRSINRDVSTAILTDLARMVKRTALSRAVLNLNDITTHEAAYNCFDETDSFISFPGARDIGEALCLIYYILENLDEVALLSEQERYQYVETLSKLIETIRCWLIIVKYGDGIHKEKTHKVREGVYISDLLKFVREKYYKQEKGGYDSTKISKAVLIQAVAVHISAKRNNPTQMWKYFKNNHYGRPAAYEHVYGSSKYEVYFDQREEIIRYCESSGQCREGQNARSTFNNTFKDAKALVAMRSKVE